MSVHGQKYQCKKKAQRTQRDIVLCEPNKTGTDKCTKCLPPNLNISFVHVLPVSLHCGQRAVATDWKFAESLLKVESAEGETAAARQSHIFFCDNKVCMFRQLVSIFVKTISKQPFHWGSLETLNKGYFAENQRCLRDRTAVFLPTKTVPELHWETKSLSKKPWYTCKLHFCWGHYLSP